MSKKYHIIFMVCFSFYLATLSANAYEMTFRPRISASIEYTDNVFLTENNKQDDYILSLTPGMTAGLLGGTNSLEVSYDPTYVTYLDNSRSNTWRHSANLLGSAELSANTRFEIQDAFFLTEDPLPNRDVVVSSGPQPVVPPNTTVRTGRRKYYSNATKGLLEYNFGAEDYLNLSYTYGVLKNNDDQLYEDSKAHIALASLQYWFDARWGMGAEGGYTRGLYEQSDDFVGEPSNDFSEFYGSLKGIYRLDQNWDAYLQYAQTYRKWDHTSQPNGDDYFIYNPSIGADYLVEERTNLSANVGYFYRDIIEDKGQKNDNDSGPMGFLRLEHNFTETTTLFIFGTAGYGSSDFSSESLGFNKFFETGGSVSYEFNRSITGDVFGSYRWAKYLDTDPHRIDEFVSFGSGLTFNPLSWLAIRLQYSLRDYSSDESPGYTENRIFLGVELQPARPFSW
ncbi:MAG: outer membrane beta-barrel protein [Desulfobacterales bacterium]|jgi:hypothetical protein